MNVVYVTKRCEASMLKHAFEAAGFRCLRMKTFCDCQDQGNNRHGVIILDEDKVVLEIRRCKSCFKQHNPNLCAGGTER